ncbi:hypothetical protein GUJ93_ZPchr0013g37158 [Zizania palustris]|uniref:Uncharacterized protein n=1 Tax=Zizania palustris TaxID=103762 RepID=A0A8J5WV00_ZIZPA|nr:hypothetical protein GUJ93_ZPchr0013g37158 [Zizania palustris]
MVAGNKKLMWRAAETDNVRHKQTRGAKAQRAAARAREKEAKAVSQSSRPGCGLTRRKPRSEQGGVAVAAVRRSTLTCPEMSSSLRPSLEIY